MNPLRLHTLIARSQATRRMLGVVVALLVATTLVHHSGLAPMGMGDMHGAHGGDHAAATFCLAILAAGAAIEGLVLVRRLTRRRRLTTRRLRARAPRPVASARPGPWSARARAGPSLRLRLCVDRR